MPIRGTVSENEVAQRLNQLEQKMDDLSKQLDQLFRELRHDLSTEFKQVRGEVISPLYR